MKNFGRRLLVVASALLFPLVLAADTTPHPLYQSNFSQNWTTITQITTSDDWSGVPSITGFRGDGLAGATGVNPQTIVASDTPGVIDVNANQTVGTFSTGGVSEFHLADPTIGLAGSGTARGPYIKLYLNTSCRSNVVVAFNARDLDGGTDNSVQQIAVHYRVGNSGVFTDLPTGYIADASSGPSLATLVTARSVTLPVAAENQPLVEVRIMTSDAAGSDEYIGIDDITVTSAAGVGPVLSIADLITIEGNSPTTTNAGFTVSLNCFAATSVTYDIATQDNSATDAGNDYDTNSATGASIPSGNLSNSFTVVVNGDNVDESDESYFVNVTNVSGATLTDGQAVGTITDDDGPPTLTIADIAQNETNAGTTTFAFTVQLSAPAPAGGVSFNIATADGGATDADNDYEPVASTPVTIPSGSDSYVLNVTVNGDTTFEDSETFTVNVTSITNATNTSASATGTITNDDASPAITIADVAVTEGNAATQTLTFTVTLANPSENTATVNYTTADDSATTGDADYVLASGLLTFNPGDTSETFDVTVNGDTNAEGNEQFFINLSGQTGATLSDSQALGIIRMDDPFSVAAVDTAYLQNFDSLATTTAATTPTGWTFSESGSNANDVYAAGTGTSTAGDTDSFGTTAERAFGGLASGSLQTSVGAFYRNDTGVTITTLSVDYTGEQWRFGQADANTDRLDFQYSTNATSLGDGAATWTNVDALDFSSPVNSGTVGALDGNVPPNRTAVAFTVTGISIAPGQTFWVRFVDPNVGGSDDGLAVDDFTILANVAGGVLTIDNVLVTEGDAGTVNAVFTVSLSQPAGVGGVSFDITTADNTATIANSDYTANTVTGATIPAASSTYTFTVVVNGDVDVEPTETFHVNVTNVGGATLSDGQGVGTIATDDFTFTPIHTIQGSGLQSSFEGNSVTVDGIVTAIKSGSSGGFFVQTPDSDIDSDANTSEGIFVFTGSSVPAGAVIGNRVAVTGTVSEFPSSADPHTVTELTSATVDVTGTGQTLPAPIVLTAADGAPSTNLSQYERFEGMRVAATLTVVAPTDGSTDENDALGSSNGVFYGVIQGVARPFREAGIEQSLTIPSGAACSACIDRFDQNPEKLRVDSDNQPGSTQLNVTAGQTVSNLTGPLDYGFFEYTLLPDAASVPVVTGDSTFDAVPVPLPTELTITSFNLERFFDTVDDPGVSDVALTPTAFNNRLNKASLAIRNVLQTPDVIGVVEVENLTTLQSLAAKVNSDTAGVTNYTAYLTEGNDIGGIDVGFLVDANRVTVASVTQFGKTATFTNPDTLALETLNDRPPLLLEASIPRPDASLYEFTVIVNHFRSLIGVETDNASGRRVRAKRAAQAEYLADLVQTRQTADTTEKIIVIGDFNAFEVNDGYVDVIGTILGTPAPATEVVDPTSDLLNPNMTNLIETLPANVRYSYSFDGNAQVLDHSIVNAAMLPSLSQFAVGHLDADFPEIFRSDSTRPERISDHDAPVAYFDLSNLSRMSIGDTSVTEGNAGTTTMTFTVTLSDPVATPVTVTYTTSNGSATAGSDYTAETGTVIFAANDQSEDITIDVTGETAFEGNETFTVTLTNASLTAVINDGQATGTINNDDAPVADLSISMSSSPSNPQPGDNVTYTIVVTNNGPQPATGVVVTDDLPDGMTFVSATATQGSCSGTDPVQCNIGSLANGASATITIVAQITDDGGTFVNTATADGNESDATGATASNAIVVQGHGDIPTLSEWMLILMAAMLALAAAMRARTL